MRLARCMLWGIVSVGGSASAQDIQGTVRDSLARPVAGADVVVTGQGGMWKTEADSAGRFSLHLTGGVYLLVVQAPGYSQYRQEVVVSAGRDLTLGVRLDPEAARLEPLEVTGRRPFGGLAEFERRRSRRLGYYVTAEELDHAGSIDLSTFLSRYPVLRMEGSVPVSTRGPKVEAIGGRIAPVSCVMRVAVDGRLTPPGSSVNQLAPSQVGGIEVYPGGATIPSDLAGLARDAGCGLIVIWSRREPPDTAGPSEAGYPPVGMAPDRVPARRAST